SRLVLVVEQRDALCPVGEDRVEEGVAHPPELRVRRVVHNRDDLQSVITHDPTPGIHFKVVFSGAAAKAVDLQPGNSFHFISLCLPDPGPAHTRRSSVAPRPGSRSSPAPRSAPAPASCRGTAAAGRPAWSGPTAVHPGSRIARGSVRPAPGW